MKIICHYISSWVTSYCSVLKERGSNYYLGKRKYPTHTPSSTHPEAGIKLMMV